MTVKYNCIGIKFLVFYLCFFGYLNLLWRFNDFVFKSVADWNAVKILNWNDYRFWKILKMLKIMKPPFNNKKLVKSQHTWSMCLHGFWSWIPSSKHVINQNLTSIEDVFT